MPGTVRGHGCHRHAAAWTRGYPMKGNAALRGIAATFLADRQEAQGIDRFAIVADLVVQMRTGRTAAAAGLADDGAGIQLLANRHVDLAQMPIARRKAIAVVNLDHPAVAAVPAGLDDDAGRRDLGGHADRRPEIHA